MTKLSDRPRVDIVGSFLAPEELEQAREQLKRGEITTEECRRIEDDAIDRLIDREIASHLQIVTDGEMRRKKWDRDFWEGLGGVEPRRIDTGRIYQDEPSRSTLLSFSGRLTFNPEHPFFEKLAHMIELTAGRAEVRQTIPSPGELLMRIITISGGDIAKLYPSPETLNDDIIEAYRATIAELYRLGCRHIQLDSSIWGRLCDDDYQRTLLLGGLDPDQITDTLVNILNASIADRPADLEVTLSIAADETRIPRWDNENERRHLTRMFTEINADAFLLPFDLDTPSQLEALASFPADRRVILGLVDGSINGLENPEDIAEYVRAASRYVSPDRISISPTCGFKVNDHERQGLNYETQWSKIDLLNRAADLVSPTTEE